jgi:hypothetical protein
LRPVLLRSSRLLPSLKLLQPRFREAAQSDSLIGPLSIAALVAALAGIATVYMAMSATAPQ